MRDNCEECKGWAESMYWSHFKCMQFCHILDGDFNSQLVIPKKFAENAIEKLQEIVTLKGPSGTVMWQVKLMACDDMLILKDGWKEFLNAFSAQENDILIFKYTGNSCFHVQIFDRQSLCEKESSYFITKCGHLKPDKTHEEMNFVQASPEKIPYECLTEDIESIPQKKHKVEPCGEKEVPISDNVYSQYRSRMQKPSWTWEPVELPSETDKKPPVKKEFNIDTVTYISKRRPVTEDEKRKALRMAQKEITQGSFLIVMRPSHVYKKFFLSIPAEWLTRHSITNRKQLVHLQLKDQTWLTRLVLSSKGRGGLSYGWKDFALDNCLEEFDVCVFKLASQIHDLIVLDVIIFRVVQEVVKSIRVPPVSKKTSKGRLKTRHQI